MSYQIWALGSNGNGQLGTGNHDDVSTPIQCLFNSDGLRDTLESRPLRTVSGGNHTFLLTEDGCIYACGHNDDGRCGLKPQATITSFEKVSFAAGRPGKPSCVIDKFYHVAATWSSSIFVAWNGETQETEIYSCGTGDFGELALGAGITRCETPTFVAAFKERIVHIAASARHVIMMLSDGLIRGCGSGRYGQLGIIPEEVTPAGAPPTSIWSLHELSTLNDLTDGRPIEAYSIACGLRFTVMLARSTDDWPDQKLWILGCHGKHDKFGLRKAVPDARIDDLYVNEVLASWNTVHFELADATMISCGRNDKGQRLPASYSFPETLWNVKAGSEHAIASSNDGTVVMWGWGEHGNCGPVDGNGQLEGGRGFYVIQPKDLGARSLFSLGAGCATTFLYASFDQESLDSMEK